MRMLLLAVVGLLAAGLLTYFFLVKPGKKPSDAIDAELARRAARRQTPRPPTAGMYPELRSRALTVSPADIGLTLPADEVRVYGVVMDWAMEAGTATTVAFATGDASLYLSNGGASLGGVGHPKIAAAARRLVEKAPHYLSQTQKTDKFPLPDGDSVRFYLLTNQGVYTAQESVANFKDRSSSWLSFFEDANVIISGFRELEAAK